MRYTPEKSRFRPPISELQNKIILPPFGKYNCGTDARVRPRPFAGDRCRKRAALRLPVTCVICDMLRDRIRYPFRPLFLLIYRTQGRPAIERNAYVPKEVLNAQNITADGAAVRKFRDVEAKNKLPAAITLRVSMRLCLLRQNVLQPSSEYRSFSHFYQFKEILIFGSDGKFFTRPRLPGCGETEPLNFNTARKIKIGMEICSQSDLLQTNTAADG